MKICLVGCGGLASSVYAPALMRIKSEWPMLEYAACCDTRMEAAESFANRVGFERVYTVLPRMLDAEAPDALLAVTPFAIAPTVADEAFVRRIPILLEKPPGATFEDTAHICEAAKCGVFNQIAYNRRHMPLIRELVELLDGHKLQHIQYQMHRVNRRENFFYTTAVHGIDLVGYVAQSAWETMRACYVPIDGCGEGVANFQLLARFVNGTTAALSFCPMSGRIVEKITVVADNGLFEVDLPVWGARGDSGELNWYVGGARTHRSDGRCDGDAMFENNGFYAQIRTFLDAVAAGRMPRDDIRSAMETAKIAECVRRRVDSFQRVDV